MSNDNIPYLFRPDRKIQFYGIETYMSPEWFFAISVHTPTSTFVKHPKNSVDFTGKEGSLIH
jgi:hypothetical protein